MGWDNNNWDYHQKQEESEWSLRAPGVHILPSDYLDHEVLSDEDGERQEDLTLLFAEDLLDYLDESIGYEPDDIL